MKCVVLRLGHRPMRDKRITTHVALVARAFGANGIVMTKKDSAVEESIKDVVRRWGNDFSIRVEAEYEKFIKEWKGEVILLTMYGIPVDDAIKEIRASKKDKLIIVGSEKVSGKVFKLADYKIAIGNQPHSEVSALAIFLDRLFSGREFSKNFHGEIRILPSNKSKRVVKGGHPYSRDTY